MGAISQDDLGAVDGKAVEAFQLFRGHVRPQGALGVIILRMGGFGPPYGGEGGGDPIGVLAGLVGSAAREQQQGKKQGQDPFHWQFLLRFPAVLSLKRSRREKGCKKKRPRDTAWADQGAKKPRALWDRLIVFFQQHPGLLEDLQGELVGIALPVYHPGDARVDDHLGADDAGLMGAV